MPAGNVVRVQLGKLGLAIGITRVVLAFRRAIEGLVLAEHGRVDVYAAKRIRTACMSLAESKRAQLRLAKGDLTEEQTMGWSDRLVRNEAACDRALVSLGLDRQQAADVFDAIYREQAVQQAADRATEQAVQRAADRRSAADGPNVAATEDRKPTGQPATPTAANGEVGSETVIT